MKKKLSKKSLNDQGQDKEQRRITRLGAIVAIIVALISLCVVIFKILFASSNIWPNEGFIYWYFMFYSVITVSYFIIVFIEIIIFILNDLKRYDIANFDYKKYDKISDAKYSLVIYDFKLYSLCLLFISSLIIPLLIPYVENKDKIVPALLSLFILVYYIFWIYRKLKNITKVIIDEIFCKIGRLCLVAFLCFLVSLSFSGNSAASIGANYAASGSIEITSTSSHEFGELIIEVYRNDNLIATRKIEEKELLFAKENKFINSEVNNNKIAEGFSLKDEILHWNTVVNLKDIIKEEGRYYVSIIITKKGKKVILSNMFDIENDIYEFAKDCLIKNY